MVLFDFKLENHFVGSSDGTSLQVYELTKSSADFSSIHKADWKKLATINPQPDDDVVAVDSGHTCDGLQFSNVSDERIEEPEMLTMLAQHLNQLRLLASPEGYCFQKVSDFGVHYLRLNDLFSWPRYGVKLVTVNTTWSRLELKLLKDEYDHEMDMKTELQKSTKSSHINVLIILLGQLQRQLKKKEERIQEVEKLNDDLEEANETKDEELHKLQRQLKWKDGQLEMLKRKLDGEVEASDTRIAELEMQKEDSEEANRAKDKELQKLKRQLKKKSQRIEELEKMNEELEEAKDDDEVSKLKKLEIELRKLLKAKDSELQVLRKKKQDDEAETWKLKEELEARTNEVVKLMKEKDDEVTKTIKVEGELKEVKEKLSSSVAKVAEVKKELEECQRKKEGEKKDEAAKTRKVEAELKDVREKLSSSVADLAEVKKELEKCERTSWAILPSTKFIPRGLDGKAKYLSTRRPVPPTTFICNFDGSSIVSNSHKLVDNMRVGGEYGVRLVDEENSHSEWPPLPQIVVWVGRGNEDFDKTNWWYLKTTHPEGGLTMLVYYEGNRSQISHDCCYSWDDPIIQLPFSKGILEVYSIVHTFSLFRLHPFGVRGVKFGFAYRPT